jgi:hypothetical protein
MLTTSKATTVTIIISRSQFMGLTSTFSTIHNFFKQLRAMQQHLTLNLRFKSFDVQVFSSFIIYTLITKLNHKSTKQGSILGHFTKLTQLK